MTTSISNPVDTDALAKRVAATFPPLTERGRHVALETYRTLALGRPVPDYAIAAGTDLQIAEVIEEMNDWPGVYRNDSGRIVGFWGLTLEQTAHQLTVDGVRLFTWCAWDTLFIPELLGEPATVQSHSPVSGESIAVEVGDANVTASPPAAAVSFVDPGQVKVDGARIISTFCHQIHFFTSRNEGEGWIDTTKQDASILSLEQAFRVGHLFNGIRFGTLG